MELKNKLPKEIPFAWLLALGAALLPGLWLADRALAVKLNDLNTEAARMEEAVVVSGAALEDLRALRENKLKEVGSYREALKSQALSKKVVYEAGAALQEEKRLLEKQLEIITTYLVIDEQTGRIRLMRGDHALNDFPFSYAPLKAFGSAPLKMSATSRVVSKERYANPERGKVQEADGKITWDPPQVGKDPRSGGLGEYVLFTDGPLILHGPPPKKELHEAYPHVCAGVTAYTAKQLYEGTFVGTKIIYSRKK